MRCFRPLTGYQAMSGGPLSFESSWPSGKRRQQVRCGQCIGCRLTRSQSTAIRCMHEMQMHSDSCFLTLTYADAGPLDSLVYKDFQDFIKRVRARFARARGVSTIPISYYVAGEYGELFRRPHFHACVFGIDFRDKVYHAKMSSGSKVYRSALLEDLWPHGFSSIGAVTFESAAYVARYCVSKLSGARVITRPYGRIDLATGEVLPVIPEFCHWSLKPGIGRRWLERYGASDMRDSGQVTLPGGRRYQAPRYYDNWYSTFDPLGYEGMKMARELEALSTLRRHQPTLKAQEQVAEARGSFLKRL